MIKAVLFDFDQTLVDSTAGFRQAEHWLQRVVFSHLNPGGWETFIQVWRSLRASGPGSEDPASKTLQWLEVCRRFGPEPGESLLQSWESDYWSLVEKGTVPLPEASSVLSDLGRRFRLGMVTNAAGIGTRPPRLDLFPQLKVHFDAVVTCGGKGHPPKPHPAGFLEAVRLLGISPGEAVFVGDNWETDILGARGAGLFPIWLRHQAIRRKPAPPPVEPVVLIDHLAPLQRLQPEQPPAIVTAG